MKNTRRMKRMARNHKKKLPGMNLTSLMDVFTILVFFLLVNSSNSEVLEPPKKITLPDSVVETKPRETTVIVVSDETVTVQGEAVVTVEPVDGVWKITGLELLKEKRIDPYAQPAASGKPAGT